MTIVYYCIFCLYNRNIQYFRIIKFWRFLTKCSAYTPREVEAPHKSMFLTGMLVWSQISITQNDRMNFNSNTKRIEWHKTKTTKNWMIQDGNKKKKKKKRNYFKDQLFNHIIVFKMINMKRFYDFMLFSTVRSSFKGVKCVIQTFKDPK